MDITLGARNEYTKRFNFVRGDDGDVAFDETEAHAVMTSVIERKRSYWADPTHGSELFDLRNLTSRTPSQAEAMVLDALSSLEQANAITNIVAVARVQAFGQLAVDVTWNTPSGMPGSATAGV
jgi:phage gp46-like protein